MSKSLMIEVADATKRVMVPLAILFATLGSSDSIAKKPLAVESNSVQYPHGEIMRRSATGEFISESNSTNQSLGRDSHDGQHTTATQPSTSPVTFTPLASTLLSTLTDVVVSGNYAYCAAWTGLVVFDISNPSAPVKVGELRLSASTNIDIWDIAKYGNYLYLPNSAVGLYVVDISNPAAPALITINTYITRPWHVIVDGSYAYEVEQIGGGYFGVLDLSTPSNPVGVGEVPLDDGSCLNKSGNYVFVSDYFGTLHTVDVSVPSSPTVVGTPLSFVNNAWNSSMNGNLLCAVSVSGALMKIADVSNPLVPTMLGTYTTSATQGVDFLDPTTVVLARKDQGLEVVDVTSPGAPVSLGTIGSPGWQSAVSCVGSTAFVAAQDGGIRAYDLSTPSAPSLLGAYTTGYIYGVKVAGNHAYVGSGIGGLKILDITNPSAPLTVSNLPIPTIAYYLDYANNYAYVPADVSGLQIVDVSNPASPTIVGSYNTPGSATQVVVRGQYAYVADYTGGLQILDITNPASPAFVGSYTGTTTAARIALSGNFAYIGNRTNGMLVVDISNPASPAYAGQVSIPGDARGVAIRGQRAYVADDYGYLRTVDISNPLAPALLPSYSIDPYFAFGVTIDGGFAFATCGAVSGNPKVVALDVGDPQLQSTAGTYSICSSPRDISIQGTVLSLAEGSGLQILNANVPCCLAQTGNVDCDSADGIDISDLTALIDHLFISFAPLCCKAEANTDGQSGIDISDLTTLIDHLFISFTPTAACQ